MRTFIIYCEPCNFKKIVEDPRNVGLQPVGTRSVQGRIPVYNKESKKTETFENVTCMPSYRCPSCGRAVILKKFNVPTT